MYQKRYRVIVTDKQLQVSFYVNANGKEPVRDWLKSLPAEDCRAIGTDLKTVEYGWPIGMPTCRAIRDGLWEVRTSLRSNKIARVLFYAQGGHLVLLHGFIKKTQTTPKKDIDLALERMRS